ncbi:hypothetical protein [Marivita sp.]|uniref:hypothetical protein n=1 Tax=Marivita sp. TaxID=2003365 RepID=UPI0025BC3A7A|nr:hypothetical protein [Marivita sp.]
MDLTALNEAIAEYLTLQHKVYHSDWPADVLCEVLAKIEEESGRQAVIGVLEAALGVAKAG